MGKKHRIFEGNDTNRSLCVWKRRFSGGARNSRENGREFDEDKDGAVRESDLHAEALSSFFHCFRADIIKASWLRCFHRNIFCRDIHSSRSFGILFRD